MYFKSNPRLPRSVIPIMYKIRIQPNLEQYTFVGSVNTFVEIRERTDEVILNSKGLNIEEVFFEDIKNEVALASQVKLCEEEETATIKFSSPLALGTGYLTIYFNGPLNDTLIGLYRFRYTSKGGRIHQAVFTHFEATHARRAFPCWDEPNIKARFEVTLIGPQDMFMLFNTCVNKEEPYELDSNLKMVTCKLTPLMSTHLLAFTICDFTCLSGTTTTGAIVRTFVPIGLKKQGTYAFSVALKALPYLERFFAMPFPLRKLDHIAISDHSTNATGNWGLISYPQSSLLYDSANTSTVILDYITSIVCQGTANQWFGNIVTMGWWNDLWLKEGFATYFKHLIAQNIFPDYNIMTRFLVYNQLPALDLDGLHNSHPIEVGVDHPCEINAIFDTITYCKAACIIRMMHRYIGDESFRQGMRLYVQQYSYRNASTQDLWKALRSCSSKSIDEIMSTWTTQKGFPVINVFVKTEPNRKILFLSQEKYCVDGKLDESEANFSWIIPVSVSSALEPEMEAAFTLMTSKSVEIVINNVRPFHWVKVNAGCFGYYRVYYTSEVLGLFEDSIRKKKLIANDRIEIVDDLFAMVQAGRNSTVDFLKLLTCFNNEDNCAVWQTICICLQKLNILLSKTTFYDSFKRFGQILLSNIYSKLGFHVKTKNSHSIKLMRMTILEQMLRFHDNKIFEMSQAHFQLLGCNKFLEPDLRLVVYSGVAYSCDDETFQKFFNMYHSSVFQEEKTRILTALGFCADPTKIERVLQFSISDHVRASDTSVVLCSAASTKEGHELAWKFFKNNVDLFRARYGNSPIMLKIIQSLTQGFASLEKAKEVDTFFDRHPFPGFESCVLRCLEGITNRTAWLERDCDELRDYLSI